jgi:hypothetical protein
METIDLSNDGDFVDLTHNNNEDDNRIIKDEDSENEDSEDEVSEDDDEDNRIIKDE